MSFVITVSGHLSYNEDDEISKIALEKYPQYAEGDVTEERVLRAKARLTDDMFNGLLERLESDGILDNTVIVAFADHYAYGMTDSERLQQLSEEAGNIILENTPAIIYCAGYEGMTVDKYMQTTDLSPTIANLFGLDVPKEIMGSDVFDPSYEGYVIFPNNTWLTEEVYMKNGSIIWNKGMTDDEIREMNEYVSKTYEINDNILKSDYYSRLNK